MRSDKWQQLEREALTKCDDLAVRLGGNKVAVALGDIAAECRIRLVQFRPMLVEGGLAIDRDGFVMFVRSRPEYCEQFAAMYKADGGRDLPGRTRFTIAHEIVHTFFVSWKDGKPQSRVVAKHHRELDSLERTCDNGAQRLLLPDGRFSQFLNSKNKLSAPRMIEAARLFSVSTDVLLRRLRARGEWGGERGAAMIAKQADCGWITTVFACDALSDPLFPSERKRVAVDKLCPEALSLQPFGGDSRRIERVIKGRIGEKLVDFPCTIDCEPIAGDNSRILVVIRIDG